MDHHPAPHHVVEAELASSLACVSLNHAQWAEPIDYVVRAGFHHLQLSLLEHGGRACFPDHWSRHRFEPMGPLFLTPAGETLHARSDCRLQHSIVCRFEAEALERWFEGGLAWTDRKLEGSLDITDRGVRRLLLRIGDELRSPGFAADALVELLCAEVIIELARYLLHVEAPAGSGGLAPWRLRLIDDYLSEHAATAKLDDLAQLCGLSTRQLTRAFRATRGRSIGDHIAELRIKQAQTLLMAGMPIKVVAGKVGFATASAFSTAFRRATGDGPKAYRSRLSHG